jgi:hypothetical protein
MPRTTSPDWFARSTALLAIVLSIVGLYFTYRTYKWQTKESFEENILLHPGFKYLAEKKDGSVSVDVVNIGMHAIYVESVRIEVPCTSKFSQPLSECEGCKLEETCAISLYERNPTLPHERMKPMKPLEPGNEETYTTDAWDFAKYPLQEWVKNNTQQLQDELWVDVNTTKKNFRQHPFSSWFQIIDAASVQRYRLQIPRSPRVAAP